jgi:NTP pyrophosphatase (non-canonical NTP hydrolase)
MTIDDAIKWMKKFQRSYKNTSEVDTKLGGKVTLDDYENLASQYGQLIGWLEELRANRGEWSLAQLQEEQQVWSQKNFGDQPADNPFIGLVEEVGELGHGYLKMKQGIRGDAETHREEMKDAVGDIVIYLSDFCSRTGINLQEAVRETWDQVKQRDWKKNPENGVS